jgi:hypothetical protein
MKQGIKGFYSSEWNSGIWVTRTFIDVDGMVVEEAENATMYSYNITMKRMIDQASTTTIMAVPQSSSSSITIGVPDDVQVGNLPLSGNFMIKCVNAQGYESYTAEMGWGTSYSTVENEINKGCPEFREQIRVSNYANYPYWQSGRSFLLEFRGFNQDPGQFEIMSGEETPMAEHVFFLAETIVDYGTNIMYDAIPFELIYTDEVLPQVIVTVDGLPAVCKNLTCDFTYIESPYEIESFSIDGDEHVLTIEGTSLPEEIKSVRFTNVDCEGMEVSYTSETTYTDEVDEEGNIVYNNETGQPNVVETTEVTSTTIVCTMAD